MYLVAFCAKLHTCCLKINKKLNTTRNASAYLVSQVKYKKIENKEHFFIGKFLLLDASLQHIYFHQERVLIVMLHFKP